MWYVIQVRTGTEQNICLQCEKKLQNAVMERCFLPCYEEKRKVNGAWKIVKHILFPGYVFLVTNQVEELYYELQKVSGMTRLLGTGDEIIPLNDEEIDFLQSFGGEEQVVEMSTGIIEGSTVIVESGPLKGREGLIKRIDRHKRKAYLEMEMFGRRQRVEVGLEITMKTV